LSEEKKRAQEGLDFFTTEERSLFISLRFAAKERNSGVTDVRNTSLFSIIITSQSN
jgi:hypothetical protein